MIQYKWNRWDIKGKNELKEMLATEYGQKCFYCGKHVDLKNCSINRLVPPSKGGEPDIENLRLTCNHCALSKNDLTIEEWHLKNETKLKEAEAVVALRSSIDIKLKNLIKEASKKANKV